MPVNQHELIIELSEIFEFLFFKASEIHEIYPACLPIKQRTSKYAFHSGWSNPLPLHLLNKYAPGHTKVYGDFFKQVQLLMEVQDKCKDSNTLLNYGFGYGYGLYENATLPTNTYYPPGKVKDFK